MEVIIIPDKITMKDKDGIQYMSIKAKDGKPYNIFDQALFPQFEEGMAVKLTGEMSKDGRFFNTSKAERVKQIFEKDAAEKTAGMIDEIKNRSMALAYSKDVENALIQAGKISDKLTSRIKDRAKEFNKYIETGE